jgi:hypothetical protein
MGALTGLTGYMTLALGAKTKPFVDHIGDSEVLITKDRELPLRYVGARLHSIL